MAPHFLEIIAWIIAGLGLYFAGMGAIRSNLQRIPGRRFREYIGRATNTPVLAAMLGFIMGVITQTSIGVSTILAGLISRGITTIPRALPVVAWSNFGLVVLIYLLNAPLHLLGLFLIGWSGLYLQFFLRGRFRGLCESLFALGLVLLGIRLMKDYCPQLASLPEARVFFDSIPHSNLVAFVFGALARTVIQSTSTVVVLGLILTASGLFTYDQALMVLFGTGLGTGLAAHFLTAHFQGVMRQITLFEAAINVFAGTLMLILFYIEQAFHLPLIKSLARLMPGDTPSHVCSLFFMQQTLCLVFTFATLRWMPGWLEKICPTTKEQDLSRPRFISDEALQDFETGLALAERELAGLMQRLPGYLQTIRTDLSEPALAEPLVLHNASVSIINEMESFLTALSDRGGKTQAASVSLLKAQRHLSIVTEIDDCVWQIVQAFRGLPPKGGLQSVESNLIEALDALLRTAIDALSSGSPDDIEMLRLITAAPGDVVDRLRRTYLREEEQLDHAERILILSVLSQYERIVWSLQQLSRSLQAGLAPTTPA
jgi:phosphate:Na+ symporter